MASFSSFKPTSPLISFQNWFLSLIWLSARSLLFPCNSCQARVVFRGGSWQVGLAWAQQDWGVFNLTCEFKHHINVATCDITSSFNQPQPQPNNTTNGNHDMMPNANDNPQMPHHHDRPKNEDDRPQTKTATHKWQWMPTRTNDRPAHEWWPGPTNRHGQRLPQVSKITPPHYAIC